MTIDQKKSVKLLVCARHAQRALRPLKNTISLQLIWTVSPTTAVHQVSALPQKAQVCRRPKFLEDRLSGHDNRQTKGPREGEIRTHGTRKTVFEF